MMGKSPRCYIVSFVEIGPPVPEKIFYGFYYIWAWRPSWSCDLDHLTYEKRIISTSAYVGNFVHAQNSEAYTTYDNVCQRTVAYP